MKWATTTLTRAAQPEALAELGLREPEAFARTLQDDAQLGGHDERLGSMEHGLPLISVNAL